MPAQTYTPPSGAETKNTACFLDGARLPVPVQLMQYDNGIPVLAVKLYRNGQDYNVPSGADVSIRMEKPDGKHVYNPGLGLSSDRSTAYLAVTHQMTTAHGEAKAAVEIRTSAGVLGVGYIVLQIRENPMPEDAPISKDEIGVLEGLTRQAEKAADRAEKAAATLSVPDWALQPQKPTYTAEEVGAATTADMLSLHPAFEKAIPLLSSEEPGYVKEILQMPFNGYVYASAYNLSGSGAQTIVLRIQGEAPVAFTYPNAPRGQFTSSPILSVKAGEYITAEINCTDSKVVYAVPKEV